LLPDNAGGLMSRIRFAVYAPPEDGLPYVGARISESGVAEVMAAQTRREAEAAVEEMARNKNDIYWFPDELREFRAKCGKA
jgi:hypothetical protein